MSSLSFVISPIKTNNPARVRGKAGATPNFQVCRAMPACRTSSLKRHLKRLNNFFKINILGKSAHVMVTFDNRGITQAAFNNIGENCSLHKIIRAADFFGLFFKYADKYLTDNLSLFFSQGR
jgi:hypothetical protein